MEREEDPSYLYSEFKCRPSVKTELHVWNGWRAPLLSQDKPKERLPVFLLCHADWRWSRAPAASCWGLISSCFGLLGNLKMRPFVLISHHGTNLHTFLPECGIVSKLFWILASFKEPFLTERGANSVIPSSWSFVFFTLVPFGPSRLIIWNPSWEWR